MPTIDELKEQEVPPTPLFLFECQLRSGAIERWCTHEVTVDGHAYEARVASHDLHTLQLSSDAGLDSSQRITVRLNNADSHFSQVERSVGFKGAKVIVRFVFFDLDAHIEASEIRVLFQGIANPPEEITESSMRLSFMNRFSLQRLVLPEVPIEKRCPWTFPANADQRQEALDGTTWGKYSALHRCGYSADLAGGVGNLDSGSPFTTCTYTRAACEARGMFDRDDADQITRRFGGLEFVPSQVEVRSFGEKGTHLSPVLDNSARYNDSVPLVYGVNWYRPPVVFTRNDGNLTHMEVLMGMGEITDVFKVVANGIEIPEAVGGRDMSATGWFRMVTAGTRDGAFNADFADSTGVPQGDPYGSMAMLSVVVPNAVSNGTSLPKLEVLVKGLRLEQFNSSGLSLGEQYSNNPAWVLLDILRRGGWRLSELDLASFAAAAGYCGAAIESTDLYGQVVAIPRFQFNWVIQKRKSAAEIISGLRLGSSLMLRYGTDGLLRLDVENTLELQQPIKPDGSNSSATLNGGWPAYEFSDGTADFSGILRNPNSEPTIRLWSRAGSELPNRVTVEFQDEFNEYQQDSLALVDVDDALATSRQVTATFPGAGLPNFDQATRMVQLYLRKLSQGHAFVEFETTVRGVSLAPGDIIAITYAKEGFTRQPFRIVKLAPGQNFRTVRITAQWHDDAWYTIGSADTSGKRNDPSRGGLPRPLVGSLIDIDGRDQFGITESTIAGSSGTAVALEVSFITPEIPQVTGAGTPLLNLTPDIDSTGGTLQGGQTLYYAVSALDSAGIESQLSFIVRAKITSLTNTNTVTLSGMSFAAGTASFHVYRGTTPSKLLRIASAESVAGSYTDTGATALLAVPPDPNYNHTNLYWRREFLPETPADIHTATTIGNTALTLVPDQFVGSIVRISRGTGAAQERVLTTNTTDTLTVSLPWNTTPDATSEFVVASSTWNFGSVGTVSPIQFLISIWGGQTIQVSGRSANALDRESPFELNPLTRWTIGSTGSDIDHDTPPLPEFELIQAGQGTIYLQGIEFPSSENISTISSGTLSLFHWNELNAPNSIALDGAINGTDTSITLTADSGAAVNDFLQIDSEIVVVTGVTEGGLELTIDRAAHETAAATHSTATPVYLLERSVVIVPFDCGFFFRPESVNYGYSIFIPDVRIAAAELYLTNLVGSGLVRHNPYTGLPDGGLRTLGGGQVTLQVDGYLAIQTDATPPFIVESPHSVVEVFAVLREAPDGGDVEIRLRQNSDTYCTLTIASGDTVSNTVNGFGKVPLIAGSQLSLDIVSVPIAPNTLPGRDLTVTVRL